MSIGRVGPVRKRVDEVGDVWASRQSTETIVFFGSVTTVANLVFIRFAFGNLFLFV